MFIPRALTVYNAPPHKVWGLLDTSHHWASPELPVIILHDILPKIPLVHMGPHGVMVDQGCRCHDALGEQSSHQDGPWLLQG